MKQFKFVIDKTFHFEMGHRVWAQKLNNPEFCLTTECACKHLHGHSYKILVFLGADELDESSMVTDFKNLNFVKKFVDEKLDHKFMIDINDPNYRLITGMYPPDKCNNFEPLPYVADEMNADEQLHLNSFVLVNFCPTSENICKHLFEHIKETLLPMPHVVVTGVELWETAKSHCRYEE